MSVLSRAGNGPGEYTNISDFEVYESEKGWVICICDATHLKSYLQDEELQWQYVGSIEYPFIVNKFHRISADRIFSLQKTCWITFRTVFVIWLFRLLVWIVGKKLNVR